MDAHLSKDHALLKSLSVLYVEDNPDIRGQLTQFLQRRVGTLLVAENGQEGLDAFHRHQPDIVITDILMPVMDGLKMAEAIKAVSEDTPIIVTTAFNEQDYFIRAIDIGVDKYVLKPVDTHQLQKAVLKSAQSLQQRRELQSRNAFINYILDVNPNFVAILDHNRELEYINQTFLAYLGFASLEAMKESGSSVDSFITQVDGTPFVSEAKAAWSVPILDHPEVEHVIYLKNPQTGGTRAFVVNCIQFSELDKYIFSFADVTHMEWEKAALEHQATTDSLTGIYNREKFDDSLNLEIDRAKRYGSSLSLIMFDIDYFKQVNDTYGHQVGDLVLVNLAQLVAKHIREHDIFARWGGEEFMILAPGISLDSAQQMASKLRALVEETVFPVVGRLTISLGVTPFRDDDTPRSFTKRVDDALYRAKRGGRNRVETE
jgi:two-component system cell cycle response regulator